jgi:hypothetical protein
LTPGFWERSTPLLGGENLFEKIVFMNCFYTPNEPSLKYSVKKGVPMGLALSPLMAVMVLQYVVERSELFMQMTGCWDGRGTIVIW